MTREEAISILWQYDVNFEPHPAEDVMHAIDMAIEALKAQDVPDMNDGDMIYRQDAIDAAKHAWAKGLEPSQYIEELPSAQPVVKDIDVPSTDTISRQAAIDALRTCYDTETISMDNGDEYINYGDAVGEIEHLPSAQPEQLTDKEQRIFLAAMGREEKVCKQVDEECCREPYEDSLVRVCHEIIRKVKAALWET